MKKAKHSHQRRPKMGVLHQLCNLIPPFLVSKLAKETGVDKQARTFSPWSHVVALLYAQLTHAIGLNDVSDALQFYRGPLSVIRGATAPSRNAFSHANAQRNAQLGERLLWEMLEHLTKVSPGFGQGKRRLPRFKRCLQAVDATVIQLVANCMSWAKHRRRKAATKLHLRFDLQSHLPRFAVLDLAPHHENTRAAQLCAGLKEGEVAIFDKGYLALRHLWELTQRGVFWVTRAKETMDYRVCRRLIKKPVGPILRDELVCWHGPKSKKLYPSVLRRVVVVVQLDGQEVPMTFLSNHQHWSAQSIADLYRCRWDIESFFRQIKQALQLGDFLGNSANAVHWQIWTALLTYVLLRYQAFLSRWQHSFTRLWALLRTTLWQRLDLLAWLQSYGTAGGHFCLLSHPVQACFAWFGPPTVGQQGDG